MTCCLFFFFYFTYWKYFFFNLQGITVTHRFNIWHQSSKNPKKSGKSMMTYKNNL